MALRTMTVRRAEQVWGGYHGALAAAEAAIEVARRANFRNGFYSPEPQICEARAKLQAALDMLPDLEVACEVLG